tara:strand:- start:265 stop:519 length:255 start_codon:yes stop_codon:yes gene_type:complete
MDKMRKVNSFKRNRNKPLKKHIGKMNGYDRKHESKPRGRPHEIQGKYEILARDASSAGDRVAAENYMQHAEHYLRMNNAIKKAD